MRFKLKVKPGTSQEKIIKVENSEPFEEEEYIIYLRAKAHDGEANIRLIKLLSDYFDVPKTSIRIVRGEKGREKIIEI